MGEWANQGLDNLDMYRDLPGFHGYKIGKDGSAWSVRKNGKLTRLFGYKTSLGYRQLKLTDDSGVAHPIFLHTAVLMAFSGPRPDGNVCRHLDGNPGNNRLDNLAYGTQKENLEDCLRHGTIAHGEKCGLSKLDDSQIESIRKMRFVDKDSFSVIARRFSVCQKTIANICHGRTWARTSGGSREPVYKQEKLSGSDVVRIVDLVKSGMSQYRVAGMFNVNQSVISRVCSGKAHKDKSTVQIGGSRG